MKEKIIRDLIYDYISIDENIGKVIDNVSFQRLKGISQLTAHHLFPSANHSRFEHSLGVMYLAITFFNQLEGKIEEKLINEQKINKFTEEQRRILLLRLKGNLRYAALLHDVGHGPLSHLGESFFDKDEIKKELEKRGVNTEFIVNEESSKHELMSCYVIAEKFFPILNEIEELKEIIDYDFIFRIITGTKYHDTKRWADNLAIEIVNSPTIDVDKLDYLMRDSFMIGNIGPQIDLKRLVLSLTIDKENHLSFTPMAIQSLINLKDSRDFLYLWVYNHHTVVYTDFLYKTAITHLVNPDNIKTKPENRIKRDDLFSPEAIANRLISDHDINHYLYREYSDKDKGSKYSEKILSQLLERKFLKPIWKTIDSYKNFMSENFSDRKALQIEEYLNKIPERIEKEQGDKNEESIGGIVSKIIERVNKNGKYIIEQGDIFIIKRSNKFYSMSKNSKFWIYYENEGVGGVIKQLDKVIPSREYDKIYSKIAFYIFTKSELINEVKDAFIKVMDNMYLG